MIPVIVGSDPYNKWSEIGRKVQQLKLQVQQKQNALAFAFVEVCVNSVENVLKQFLVSSSKSRA